MKRIALIGLLLLAACSGARPVATTTQQPATTPQPTPDPTVPATFGRITFGTSYDPDTLEIAKPITKFKRTIAMIAWSASLSDTVNATSIELVIASQSASGTERVIERVDIDVANPDSDTLANKVDLASIVGNKAGTYVMRYIRDGKVLAEGTFTLVK